MDRSERARLAARARWDKTPAKERQKFMAGVRATAAPKPDTRLKRLRTEAKQLGYELVPLTEDKK